MANFIWDLDGTLINSYPHTLEALAETYQALPIWWLLARLIATIL